MVSFPYHSHVLGGPMSLGVPQVRQLKEALRIHEDHIRPCGFGPPLRDDVPQRGWEVDRLGVNVWGSKSTGGRLPTLPETNRQKKKNLKMNFPKLGAQRTYFFRWENVGFRECICIYIYYYLLVEIPGKYSPVKWHSWLENGHNLKMYVLLKINMFPLLC